jgi:hypothetical protein
VSGEAGEQRGRRRRSRLARALIGGGTALGVLLATAAGYVGFSLYRIDHDVHHVAVPAALLARGQDDLLTMVRGPDHSEEIYLFHTTASRTNVLVLPRTLGIRDPAGRVVPIGRFDIHAPAAIIAGLRGVGIPVTHYVGVDLHMVSPTSSLGRLARGKLSVTTLISNPTGTASLLEEVASHVYLGPHTPPSALLELMHVPAARPVPVPTFTSGGHVVLAGPAVGVLRRFF